jgi:hypothetical protein
MEDEEIYPQMTQMYGDENSRKRENSLNSLLSLSAYICVICG